MAISDYPEKLTNGYYRVRETWEDASSQIGAYKILTNAIAVCDKNSGTCVFDMEGNAIYPEMIENESGKEEETGIEETGKEEAGSDSSEIKDTDDADDDSTVEFPEAIEYENDGNDTPVAYTKLRTLMNIRVGNSLDADIVTVYRKGTIIEVLQICSNNWLRFACTKSPTGYAYVSNEENSYNYGVGFSLYTVKPKENIKTVAKNAIGDECRYMELRELNGLNCNILYVGMKLVLPEFRAADEEGSAD